MSWMQTLMAIKGGLNAAAGTIRIGHLDFLSDEVRDRRVDLKAANDAADVAIAKAKLSSTGENVVLALEAQAKVDKMTYGATQSQAVLDRAQNEQAFYQAISGGFDLGSALLGDGAGGMGGGMGGGAGMALAAAGGGLAGGYIGSRANNNNTNNLP